METAGESIGAVDIESEFLAVVEGADDSDSHLVVVGANACFATNEGGGGERFSVDGAGQLVVVPMVAQLDVGSVDFELEVISITDGIVFKEDAQIW